MTKKAWRRKDTKIGKSWREKNKKEKEKTLDRDESEPCCQKKCTTQRPRFLSSCVLTNEPWSLSFDVKIRRTIRKEVIKLLCLWYVTTCRFEVHVRSNLMSLRGEGRKEGKPWATFCLSFSALRSKMRATCARTLAHLDSTCSSLQGASPSVSPCSYHN